MTAVSSLKGGLGGARGGGGGGSAGGGGETSSAPDDDASTATTISASSADEGDGDATMTESSSSSTTAAPSSASTTSSTSSEPSSSSASNPVAAAPAGNIAAVAGDDFFSSENGSLELKSLGNDCLKTGKILRAIYYYTQALQCSPSNAILLSNRSMAYVKVENYGLAIQDATDAIDSDPKYAKAYYRRGTASYALHKYKSARKDFRRVVQLRPRDKDARVRLASCERAVREVAFAEAIGVESTSALSDTYDPREVIIDRGYDGPHPGGGVVAMIGSEGDREEAMFRPGCLPLEFVMVR